MLETTNCWRPLGIEISLWVVYLCKVISIKNWMGPYQRTPKRVTRAIKYPGLGVRSVGPVGDFLDCKIDVYWWGLGWWSMFDYEDDGGWWRRFFAHRICQGNSKTNRIKTIKMSLWDPFAPSSFNSGLWRNLPNMFYYKYYSQLIYQLFKSFIVAITPSMTSKGPPCTHLIYRLCILFYHF